jgi:DNA-binding MurR/RpiR family transcriptional regulator
MAGTPTHDAVLVTLRGLLPTLVPSLRRVAERILDDPAGAAGQTISELAAAAETSESTVLRLCHQVGVSGYRDLRVVLAAEAGREEARGTDIGQIGRDIGRHDRLDAILRTITAADQQAIADTIRTLDRAALAEAVTLIARARRVNIYGVGASAVVALDLEQKLERIGAVAAARRDVHAALTSAALLSHRDVAIGISHTGATRDTVEALAEAGRHGAHTIGLTSVPRSPLADVADLLLVTAARETTFRSGATASRLAQLTVIDCIFVGVAQHTYEQSLEALRVTHDAVRDRRIGENRRRIRR